MSESTAGPGNIPDADEEELNDAEEIVPDSHAADVDAGFDDTDDSPTEVTQPEDGSF